MSVKAGAGSLVSVVIPSYNRAYCLERTVDSVLGQTHREVEVVIVDDGSTDDTGELVLRRWGRDSRVLYHRQANAGISAARNAGLARTSGDYVALLDSDDEWMPWKLELQLGCMRAHPEVGMTWTDMIAVGPEGEVVSQAYLRQMYSAYRWFPTAGSLFRAPGTRIDRLAPQAADVAPGRNFYCGDIGARMLMGNLVHTSTVVMTRARAEAVKSFREDLSPVGEDYEFHLRTTRVGPVGYLDVASIKYQRGRPDQATVSPNAIHMARNFLRVIEPILVEERGRIDLPLHMQNAALAEAHAWVGEMLLDRGETDEARRALGRSLARRPWQARTARLMLAAYLPPAMRESAKQAYRVVRDAAGARRRD